MNKTTRSWMVPVSTFALALVLAILAGPKPKLFARPPGDPSAPPPPCVSDLTAFSLVVDIDAKGDITVFSTYSLKHGVPAAKSHTTVGGSGKVRLEYKVKQANGAVVNRPLDVELTMVPGIRQLPEDGVVDSNFILVQWAGKIKELDKAVKVASVKLGPGETFAGEDLLFRNPLVMTFTLHSLTKKQHSDLVCQDDISAVVPVPIDADGTGHAIKFVEK